MCGRLNLHDHRIVDTLMRQLGLPELGEQPPRYNITPTASLQVLVSTSELVTMEWSIEFGKFRHPNTKVETLRRKRFLQELLMRQRCLVPVNRFYEWPDAKVRPKYTGIKTRFCIHTPPDVMFLGGIYKISPDGVPQFNILTTNPNTQINDFHHRMPVIVRTEQVTTWLNANTLRTLDPLLEPNQDTLVIYECDPFVNNGRHDTPQCMMPLSASGGEA